MSEPLNQYIDHTLLKPEATPDQISILCREALMFDFCAVCVNPHNVATAAAMLASSAIKIATVIGFPLGATTTAVKAFETREAIKDGADELDMVINIGALKAGLTEKVFEDISTVVLAADGHLVKVILETALLSQDEKRVACQLAMEAGAHFVKTSTGFGPGGATLEDVALLRQLVGSQCGV